MAVISPVATPVNQTFGPAIQSQRAKDADPADTNSVKPSAESDRSKADTPGNGNVRSSFGRDEAAGVNGGSSKSGNQGATSTGNAGLLSRGTKVSSSGAREGSADSRAEAADRARARSSGGSYESGRSVVESVAKADPSAKVTDIVARAKVDPATEAKINAQRFVETLDEVRKAEAPVANDNDRPVALNTNDSSEPVGRYDKSA